jgi:hypothetical protein
VAACEMRPGKPLHRVSSSLLLAVAAPLGPWRSALVVLSPAPDPVWQQRRPPSPTWWRRGCVVVVCGGQRDRDAHGRGAEDRQIADSGAVAHRHKAPGEGCSVLADELSIDDSSSTQEVVSVGLSG